MIMELNNENKIPNFLIELLQKQYSNDIVRDILNGYEKQRVISFRVNTLKSDSNAIKNELSKTGIEYETLNWNTDAFIIKNSSKQDIEALEIYKRGEIYLQSLSSMLPPIILNPKPNEDILDMCAAPGGKTTQIATLSKNSAHITACEINTIRLERLKYNIEKQGASCVYIMQKDARKIDDFFSFDSILLDAPCSGSGTLNIKDKNLEKTFTMNLINKSTSSQLALLKKAINILKPGKEMVYSTCSILSCENEDILTKALVGTNAEIVPIEFEGINNLPLLPVKINGTVCVCPNELYEGFFIAKIRKNK